MASRSRFIWRDGDVVVTHPKKVKKARKDRTAKLGSYHRHTDRIVEHYSPLIARAFEDMFPANALHTAIQRVKDSAPAPDQVAKADTPPPSLVAAALAAVRAAISRAGGLKDVLTGLYGDGALQAAHAAAEATGSKLPSVYATVTQGAPADYWSAWTPGWGEAAAQASDGGLRTLLDQADITIQSVTDSRLDDLGDAIARGIQNGDNVQSIASACQDILSNPSRAEMIANTEMGRAMTAQSLFSYQQLGVQQIEWLAEDDACPDCQENEDASPIALGDSWPNGDQPVHPNCRCGIAPVVNTGDEGDQS